MQKLKRILKRASDHSLHLIVGLDLMVTGFVLLSNHHYFFYPPYPKEITLIENNSIVGFLGITVGALMICWVFGKDRSVKLNQWLTSLAAGYFAILSVVGLTHLFAPNSMPNMITDVIGKISMMLICWYMAKNNKSEGDHENY